jgi:hypothetical protein
MSVGDWVTVFASATAVGLVVGVCWRLLEQVAKGRG